MAKVVGDVAIKVGADTTSLVTGMRKSEVSMAKFAKVGAASAAAVGAALVALTKKSMENIDAMAKQARSLGLTTDAFQKMAMVADEAGVDTKKLSASLGILQRNITEAGKGTKTQADAFKALGLSMVDLEGKTPDEQFEKLADALDRVEDPAKRTALAMDTLGRGGRDMINMLGGYGEKARDAALFQERFGIAVRQSAAEGVEQANDAVGRLGMAMEGLGNRMATKVAPAVEVTANAIVTFTGKLVGAKVTLEEFFGTLDRARETLGEDLFNKLLGNPQALVDHANAVQTAADATAGFKDNVEVLIPAMGAFSAHLNKIGQSGPAEEMRKLTEELYNTHRGFSDGTIKGEEFKQKVIEIRNRADTLVGSLSDVDGVRFGGIHGALNSLGVWIDNVAEKARSLRQEMADMDTGIPLYEQEKPVEGWLPGSPNAPASSPRPRQQGVDSLGNWEAANAPKSKSGGGGGGGVTDPRAAKLESLVESLKSEQEIIATWYAESLEMLNTASDAELAALGGKHEAIERLEEEHQNRLGRIRELGNKWGVEAALEGGAAILGAMSSTNKKAAKLQGIFAAAAALMSTYQGAAKELEKGTFGFATAAAVIAKGLGFVSAIKSASDAGSNGVAAASGGSGGAAAPAAPQERRVAEFRFMGGNMLDPRAIVDAMNEAYDQGYQIRGVLG